MADSLPNSIGLSALMRYDEFVAMIGPDKDWPVPKDKNSLQKFWGLANYFRIFIMGWAVLVSALQALLKKSDTFEWKADCDTALFAMLLCWPCQI